MTSFDDNLLETKKLRFKEFVDSACVYCGLDYTLRIEYVDYYKSDNAKALAWIDTISQIIYVALPHLREMHIEDIKKTAFHEVIHLFIPNHEPEFYRTLDNALLENWKPENTSGIIMKRGNTRLPEIKNEPIELDMIHCNHHLCRKGAELKQCPHCERYYCELHILPRPPTMPEFDFPNKYDGWKKSNNHACPPYYDFLCQQERIRIKRIDDVFNSMHKKSFAQNQRYKTFGVRYRWSDKDSDLPPTEQNSQNLDPSQKKDNLMERRYQSYGGKLKTKHNYLSRLKYKLKNARFKSYRKLTLSTSFVLGLFIPLFVGFLIIYFLLPGFSAYAQYFGAQNSVLLMLYALVVPMQVESIVPWIAWVVSGFVGGFLTKKILIPFVSMYILIWVFLYFLVGNLLAQYFSLFGMYDIGQIILQTLIVNLIISLLAFGFGGWIGASIGR